MRAAFCTRYGPPEVVELRELPTPVPRDNEIRVRVRATTLHVGDTRMRAFRVPAAFWLPARLALGVFKPRNPVLGMELAGEVDAVGKDVTRFAVGDRVLASKGFVSGAHAEFTCVPGDEGSIRRGMALPLPDSLSWGQGAALPNGAITAHLLIRSLGLGSESSALVYGASGSVGSFAVQLLKQRGVRVTALCSGRNLELVQGLGADTTLDYTTTDLGQHGERYDLVLDAVGLLPRRVARSLRAPGGTHRNVNASSEQRFTLAELQELVERAAAGALQVVIDRHYAFDDIVEAHRYVDTGRKRGHVVIDMP